MTSIERWEFRERLHLVVAHENTVYLTGQVGTAHTTIAQQTREALERIDRLLKTAGSEKSKILHANIWLDDMRSFGEFNEVWDDWVSEAHAPARSTGQVRLNHGIGIEITIIAAK
jgi:enamine deaminase RidA (YjgF/YER057c/UK114 family)